MLRNYSTEGAWLNIPQRPRTPRWKEVASFTSPAGEVSGLASGFPVKRVKV